MFRDLLARALGALFPAIVRIESKLDRVLLNQKKEEARMATAQEALDRVVREGQETHQKLDGLLTTTQEAVAEFATWPDRVKKAVEDALAANPGVDLSGLSAVADDMDAGQARMDAAQQALLAAIDANKPPVAPALPVEEPEQPAPAEEPAPGDGSTPAE